MLTTEATVETESASRYLAQLCRHFGNLRRHESKHEPEEPPELHVDVEWSDMHGAISFEWGRCTLRAEPDALALSAEAPDQEGLQRVKDLVGGHVERFGSRDHLSVNWR